MSEKKIHEDQKYIDGLLKNNSFIIQAIYDKFVPKVINYIKQNSGDTEQAQDVVQDSFVKIWRKIDSYDETKGSFFTWMLNITRNTCIDFIRKTKKEGASSIQDIENNVHISNDGISTDTIGMTAIVNNLNEDQRILVEYIYFKGYTQQEVSDELGIPLGTVKTRIRAAVSELKKYFLALFLFWI